VFAYTSAASKNPLDNTTAVQVLVSKGVIGAGVSLSEAEAAGLVVTQTFPTATVPNDAIKDVDSSNSSLLALAPISSGQILISSAFGVTLQGGNALQVPNGMIAISVSLEDPQKVAEFLSPGSKIVIFDTVTPVASDGKPLAQRTRVLLSDVRVIGVGSRVSASDANAQVGTIVTVAVDQISAEKLVHASIIGSLYFGLLGDGTVITDDPGINDANLHG
jgi:pilus assembly protein CpaB